MKLIVGLGNPGKDYEYTRHNLGFLVVRYLADRVKTSFKLCSLINGLSAECTYKGQKFHFLLPLTYMNRSGLAVKAAAEKKESVTKDILIVCDDLNLPFGQMRLKRRGRDGGHNGLKSIIQELGVDDFPRLRLGIDRPDRGKSLKVDSEEVVDYVLGQFIKQERAELDDFITKASDCCLVWLMDGPDEAMDRFNNKG